MIPIYPSHVCRFAAQFETDLRFLGGLYNSQTNAKTQARVSEAAGTQGCLSSPGIGHQLQESVGWISQSFWVQNMRRLQQTHVKMPNGYGPKNGPKVCLNLFWTHSGTIEALIQEGIKLVEDSKISSLAKKESAKGLSHWIQIGTKDGNMMKYDEIWTFVELFRRRILTHDELQFAGVLRFYKLIWNLDSISTHSHNGWWLFTDLPNSRESQLPCGAFICRVCIVGWQFAPGVAPKNMTATVNMAGLGPDRTQKNYLTQ